KTGLKVGLDKGREEGREAGLEEGRRQATAGILQHLVTQRFGRLESITKARIEGADMETLQRWIDNLLRAQTLEQVFESRLESR
ncbi:MAG: transposase, partial [Oleiphilaceae bacterium]|nr:transposase [Oleiphilaceae bacterium]